MQTFAEDSQRGRGPREQRLVEDLLARVDVEVQLELLGQLQHSQSGVDGLLLVFRLGGGNGAADVFDEQALDAGSGLWRVDAEPGLACRSGDIDGLAIGDRIRRTGLGCDGRLETT